MAKSKAAASPKQSKVLEKKTVSANNFIALMALVCVMVIAITGYVATVLGKDAFMQTKLIAKKIEVQKKYSQKIENATSLIDEYHQLGPRRTLIEHGVPGTADFPQIVSLVEFAGKSAGIDIKSIKPDSSGLQASDVTLQEATPTAQAVSFTTEVEGSYPRMIAFLKNLELSVRPLRVSAAEFKGNDEKLKVTLEVQTAYQVKTEISDPIKELK